MFKILRSLIFPKKLTDERYIKLLIISRLNLNHNIKNNIQIKLKKLYINELSRIKHSEIKIFYHYPPITKKRSRKRSRPRSRRRSRRRSRPRRRSRKRSYLQ